MRIEDQILEVKVWNHNDAVVFVYEHHNKATKKEDGTYTYEDYYDVLTAVPINFGYDDESLTEEEKYAKVKKVADALADVYQHEPDYEMGVSIYMNTHPYL